MTELGSMKHGHLQGPTSLGRPHDVHKEKWRKGPFSLTPNALVNNPIKGISERLSPTITGGNCDLDNLHFCAIQNLYDNVVTFSGTFRPQFFPGYLNKKCSSIRIPRQSDVASSAFFWLICILFFAFFLTNSAFMSYPVMNSRQPGQPTLQPCEFAVLLWSVFSFGFPLAFCIFLKFCKNLLKTMFLRIFMCFFP